MLFSVLIANYNNARFLPEAIGSVMAQSYTRWEIILVDDASTDDFESVIQQYQAEPRIRVFRNTQNRGCGYTKRRCAEEAAGIIAAYLDPDDALPPDALRLMAEAHDIRPNCSIVSSTHYICDEHLAVKRVADYPRALPPNTPYLLLSDGSIHALASFKMASYHQTAGVDLNNQKAVDQDLYYKLEEAGEVFFIDQPLYYYRIHQGGISTFEKRHAATLCHYAIIEEACLRRIEQQKDGRAGAGHWIKAYRTRYYKIRILHSFRKKDWGVFLKSLLIFPFIGGMGNVISYCKKLPREGIGLVKRTLTYDHEIK